MRRINASLRADWKSWFELCGQVLDGRAHETSPA
jgi:hypothetical protein